MCVFNRDAVPRRVAPVTSLGPIAGLGPDSAVGFPRHRWLPADLSASGASPTEAMREMTRSATAERLPTLSFGPTPDDVNQARRAFLSRWRLRPNAAGSACSS